MLPRTQRQKEILDYITRFIAELEVGSVNVREVPGYRLELTPFGGTREIYGLNGRVNGKLDKE